MDHSQSCVDLGTSFVQCSKYDKDKMRVGGEGTGGEEYMVGESYLMYDYPHYQCFCTCSSQN